MTIYGDEEDAVHKVLGAWARRLMRPAAAASSTPQSPDPDGGTYYLALTLARNPSPAPRPCHHPRRLLPHPPHECSSVD